MWRRLPLACLRNKTPNLITEPNAPQRRRISGVRTSDGFSLVGLSRGSLTGSTDPSRPAPRRVTAQERESAQEPPRRAPWRRSTGRAASGIRTSFSNVLSTPAGRAETGRVDAPSNNHLDRSQRVGQLLSDGISGIRGLFWSTKWPSGHYNCQNFLLRSL